jgi:hypothetical protein
MEYNCMAQEQTLPHTPVEFNACLILTHLVANTWATPN